MEAADGETFGTSVAARSARVGAARAIGGFPRPGNGQRACIAVLSMKTSSTADAFLLARISAFVNARSTEFICLDCAQNAGHRRPASPSDQLAWCVSCGRSARAIEAALAERASRARRRRIQTVATKLAS
jgi:hypothetical protein